MISAQTVGDGRWFPANPSVLRTDIERYLEEAQVERPTERIVSALAPHAGYRYSGPVAGHTFSAIRHGYRDQNPLVVILGFTHRESFNGVAIMDADSLESPLGSVSLDRQASDLLIQSSPHFFYDSTPHQGEWSAENEIPFIQVALPDSPVVMALMGDSSQPIATDIANALFDLSQQRPLILIASTDMTHDPDYDLVSRNDRASLARIEDMDLTGLRKEWSPRTQNFCGIGPVSVAMELARLSGCTHGQVLHYRNSGDDFPESRGEWVVGYCSAIFTVQHAD